MSRPPVPPPTNHQLAMMIWIAVFPTLTALNLTRGHAIKDLPIVIYGLMSYLHRIRARLLTTGAGS